MEQLNDANDREERSLDASLMAMQRELEQELTAIGEMVGRFREMDAPEAEDLARNTLRAYDAVADVIRMVRTIRGIDLADPAGAPNRGNSTGEVIEASARDFFAEDGPGAG
jgi:hypothetical protein